MNYRHILLYCCLALFSSCEQAENESTDRYLTIQQRYREAGINKIERYFNKAGEEPRLNMVVTLYDNGYTKDSILTPELMSGNKSITREFRFNEDGSLIAEVRKEERTGPAFSVEMYPYGDTTIEVEKKYEATFYDELERDTMREIVINDRYNFKYWTRYSDTGYEYLGEGPIGETLEHGLVTKDELTGVETVRDLLTGQVEVRGNDELADSMRVNESYILYFRKFEHDNSCRVNGVTTLGDSVKVYTTFACDFNMPMDLLKRQESLNLLYENTIRYNEKGDMVLDVTQDGAGAIRSFIKRNIKYNGDGQQREIIYYDEANVVTRRRVIEYDGYGNILTDKEVNPKTASIEENVYTYGDNGLLAKKTEIVDGVLIDEVTFRYY